MIRKKYLGIFLMFFLASILFSDTVFAVTTDLYATSSGGTTKFGNTASVQGAPDGSKSCNVTGGADTDYVYGGGYSNTSGGTVNGVWITVRYNVTVTSTSDMLVLKYSLDGGSSFGATTYSFYPTLSSPWKNVTLNVTADRSWTYADIGNLRVYLYYDKVGGADAWRADIDALWVNLTFTPGAPLYSNNGTNVTEPKPNDWVLHYVNWTANSGTLSGYIFSNNYSGSWSNSTWIAFSNSWSNQTNTSTSPGVYGWRVYANNSYNQWNDTGIQIIYFSTRTLLVNWTVGSQINSTTCTQGSPCQYYQYNQFNANATVNCTTNPTGLSCGNITGGIMYNTSSTDYTWVSTTQDATPFYTTNKYTQISCSNLTNLGDNYVSSSSKDLNFGSDATIYVGVVVGVIYRTWIKFNTSFNTSTVNQIINATLYLYYYSYTSNPFGRTYNLYNTTDNTSYINSPWNEMQLTWNNQTSIDTLQSQTVVPGSTGVWMSWNTTNGLISAFNNNKNISLTIRDNDELSDAGWPHYYSKEGTIPPYLTVCYNQSLPMPNPQVNFLSHGQSAQLNYIVNITQESSIIEDYKLIFNFTSSLTNNNPPENDTNPAYIRILPTTRTLLVNWTTGSQINDTTCTSTQPCQFYQYDQFNANATVNCSTNPTGLSCGSITGGIMYNTSDSAYNWISTTKDATPFYIVGVTQANLTKSLLSAYNDSNGYNWTDTLMSIDSSYANLTCKCTADKDGNCTCYTDYINITYNETVKYGNFLNFNGTTMGESNTYSIMCDDGSNSPQYTGGFSGYAGTLYNWSSVLSPSDNNIKCRVYFEVWTGAYEQELQIWWMDATNGYYETGAQNPSQNFVTLSDGETAQLNYTVNVTDSPTKDYKLIFNFTSSFSSITENTTGNAYVKIGAAGPQTRLIQQSFSLSGTASKVGNVSKTALEPFSTITAITGAFVALRAASQTMFFSQLMSRFYTSLQILSQSLSLNIIPLRMTNLFRTFSVSLGVNNAVMKGLVYLKSISDSFITNTAITRISILSKILTQSFNINALTSRLQTLLKSLPQSLTINTAIQRIGLLFKSASQSLIINSLVSRLSGFLKSISQSFTTSLATIRTGFFFKSISDSIVTNIAITRIQILIKSLTASLAFTDYIGRSLVSLRDVLQSFATNVIAARTGMFFKQVSDYFATNTAITSLSSFFRNIQNSLAVSTTITRGLSFLRDISQSFTTNALTTRLTSFIKAASQSFTINTAITRLQSLFKTLTASLGFTDSITRGLVSLRTVSNYFGIAQISERITSLFRGVTGSFILTDSSAKIQSIFRTLSDSFSLSTISYRISTLFRDSTQYFSFSEISRRIASLTKLTSQTFTVNTAISRIQSLMKSISQSFITNMIAIGEKVGGIYPVTAQLTLTLTETSTRLFNFYRTILQSFNINLEISRLQTLIKSVINSFGVSDAITRGFSYVRSILESFTTNILTSRTTGFLKTANQSLSLNAISIRIINISRILSQAFTTNAIASRGGILLKYVSDSFSISTITSRMFSFYKIITGYFSFSEVTSRVAYLSKSALQIFNLNEMISRISFISQRVYQSFSINQIVGRAFLLQKQIIQSLSLNDFISRLVKFSKTVTGSFIFNVSTQRIQILLKLLSQSFSINQIGSRASVILKFATTSFGINDVITRIISFSRTSIQSIPISGMVLRIQFLVRAFTQQLSIVQNVTANLLGVLNTRTASLSFTITNAVGRAFVFTRTVSQLLSFNAITGRLSFLIRIFLQSFGLYTTIGLRPCSLLTTESACASYGCYYCTNVCQSTTCPTPTPPPSEGGYIIPTVPIALDVEVYMETEQVVPGDKAYAYILLQKISGPSGVVDVNLTYWIRDPNRNVVGSKSTIVGIETTRRDIYSLYVPFNLSVGTYTFEALAQYDNATAVSNATFTVVSKLPTPLINIKKVDVPLILVEQETSIKVVVESLVNSSLNITVTLILPEGFAPPNITIQRTIEPLAEDILEFNFVSNVFGSFTAFIKIEYDGRKVIREIPINVYSPVMVFAPLLKYWWIIAIIIIILILIILKEKGRKKIQKKHPIHHTPFR